MRQVSSEFLAEVGRSHRVVIEARVYLPDGDWTDIPITDGTVTLDATSAIRGRCDISVEHTEWIPRDPLDKLAPYGAEINLRRGVRFADGSTELVSLGWFGVENAEVTDQGQGAGARIEAMDRAERLAKADFEDLFTLPAGTPFGETILELAQAAWPGVPYDPALPSASSISIGKPVIAQPGDDRWDFMQGLATAVGHVLFFDGEGILTLRPYAEAGVVAEITEGEGGVLLQATRQWSRTDAINRVIATGDAADDDTIYRGVATDDNPLSPTYYYGPFGKCPYQYSHPQIISDDQAQDVAESYLAQHIGTASTVSFGMVPNPALEPEDTVRIAREDVGIDEDHIIDQLTIGLAATEQMTGSTRERLVR